MATTTTWSAPNYAGELFIVGKNKTPFLSSVGGLNGGKLVNAMDFPMASTYSLDAASQPAITETASLTAPANNNFTRNQDLNACQIYMESVNVSYTKLSSPGAIYADLANGLTAAGSNPVQNEVDFQIMVSLQQIARDVNYTFLNGIYQQATSAAVAWKTGGILSGVTTNTVSGTGAALTKANINTALTSMADNGAPFDNIVAVVPAALKIKISDLYGVQPRDWQVGGLNITRVETDFGPMGVMYDPDMPSGTILLADMAHITPVFCPVPGKGVLFYEELARTGAGVQGQIFGQIGMDYGPEEYHAKIYNVTG